MGALSAAGSVEKHSAARLPSRPYLFVVLLEVGELLTQGFVLNLQVSSAQRYFVQNSAQPVDVSLDALVESQLVFVPSKVHSLEMVTNHGYPPNSGLLKWPTWPLL